MGFWWLDVALYTRRVRYSPYPHPFPPFANEPAAMPSLRKQVNGPSVRVFRGVRTTHLHPLRFCFTYTVSRLMALSMDTFTHRNLPDAGRLYSRPPSLPTPRSRTHLTSQLKAIFDGHDYLRPYTTARSRLGWTSFSSQLTGTRTPRQTDQYSIQPASAGGGRLQLSALVDPNHTSSVSGTFGIPKLLC